MNANILYIIIVLLIVVFSVILHELAHGITAYWLGDHTAKDAGRLTFNPIKHIDPYMSIIVPVILRHRTLDRPITTYQTLNAANAIVMLVALHSAWLFLACSSVLPV